MAKYATRTCKRCGRKKSANKKYTKLVAKTYRGSSRRTINILTWLGLLFGDKGSKRAIKQWLFQSSNRRYSGQTEIAVSLCSLCYHRVPSGRSGNGCLKIMFFWIFILMDYQTKPCTRICKCGTKDGNIIIICGFD